MVRGEVIAFASVRILPPVNAAGVECRAKVVRRRLEQQSSLR
jgi:hypothetical protein